MTLLLKDPAALLDYAVDWGADYLNEDETVTSTWCVEPDDIARQHQRIEHVLFGR